MRAKELSFYPAWTNGREGYALRIREEFDKVISHEGLLKTPQRYLILDYLLHADRHLSLDEIHQGLKSKGIGRVTVFRTIKLLEGHHMLEKIVDPQGHTRYEINLDRRHAHLVCVQCGHIEEVVWPEADKIQSKVAQKSGFHPLFHKNEVYGRCEDCDVQKP